MVQAGSLRSPERTIRAQPMTDIRYALRQLIKSPSFSVTAIVALALGIGATTAMFAVIYAFLLRPLPYAEAEKLVMLQSRSTRSGSDLGVNISTSSTGKSRAAVSPISRFSICVGTEISNRPAE
jgi:hypothetical protein